MIEPSSAIEVLFFVSLETREVDEVYALHSFGLSRRANGIWHSIARDDSKLALSGQWVVYELDWDRTVPAAFGNATAAGGEHILLTLFDQGDLVEEVLLRFANVYFDPSSDGWQS